MENNIGFKINTTTGGKRHQNNTHIEFYKMKDLAIHSIEHDNYDLAIECINQLRTMVSK
jgi:hypothetical protein